jgi:hypothetical protein
MGKDPGYSNSKADRQGYQIRDLKKRLGIAVTQIEGLILCLEQHGTNLNVPFLLDHYRNILSQVKGE